MVSIPAQYYIFKFANSHYKLMEFSSTIHKNISSVGSKYMSFGLHQITCNLTGKCHEFGCLFFTNTLWKIYL